MKCSWCGCTSIELVKTGKHATFWKCCSCGSLFFHDYFDDGNEEVIWYGD